MPKMVTDTPIPAVVCCFADPESKNINRLILIAPCLARAAAAPRTEAPALRSSAEASSAQDFCRVRDPVLFCGRHCACAGRNRGTACGEWINLLADDGSDQPARSSILGGG